MILFENRAEMQRGKGTQQLPSYFVKIAETTRSLLQFNRAWVARSFYLLEQVEMFFCLFCCFCAIQFEKYFNYLTCLQATAVEKKRRKLRMPRKIYLQQDIQQGWEKKMKKLRKANISRSRKETNIGNETHGGNESWFQILSFKKKLSKSVKFQVLYVSANGKPAKAREGLLADKFH